MTALDEKSLVALVRNGDVQAFRKLVDLHKVVVLNICYSMLKNREDAEEVSQDVFVKAYQSINQYQGDAPFRNWLYRIAYTTTVNKTRKKKVYHAPLPEQNEVGHPKENEELLKELTQREQQHYIELAIAELEEENQLIIRLYYLEEMSVKDIADITSFSVSNVKVRLLRSREKLHFCLNRILKEEAKTWIR